MKKTLIIVAVFVSLLLFAHFASAQTMAVHTFTRHDPGMGANDVNIGLGYEKNGYVVGGYYNSHYRMSYYAGVASREWYRMRISLVGVTGYFAAVTPVLIPSLKLYEERGAAVWLSGSPFRIHDDGQSVLHLSLSWRL